MSEGRRSGINRAFSWLKKVTEITEKTVAPDALSPVVGPTMDLFGWERIPEAIAIANTGTNISTQLSSAVPPETTRLVLSCSVETSNNVLALWLWMEHRVTLSGIDVGFMNPLLTAAGTGGTMRVGANRPLLMAPGDRLIARSSAAVGAAETLSIRLRFVDLPIGEYILGV